MRHVRYNNNIVVYYSQRICRTASNAVVGFESMVFFYDRKKHFAYDTTESHTQNIITYYTV